MTTAARAAEADEASVAFQVALAQVGAATAKDAMTLWAQTPTDMRAEAAAGWLRRAIRLVLFRRRQSRDLAMAYYRLARALRTGSTIADPYHPEPAYVTISDLRREFAELTGEAQEDAQEASTVPSESASPNDTTSSPAASGESVEAEEEPSPDSDPGGEGDKIPVEEIPGLREDEERLERQAEQELRIVLTALGPANLEKKLRDLDLKEAAETVDKARKDAHLDAGARQAAAGERVAKNGGRSSIWNTMGKDRRVLGYVRLSRSGSPCGWCAMLISRGAILYGTEKAATFGADGDLYHDHCNCYAEPVFSMEQYDTSNLFEVNRQYEDLWPEVTKGLAGKEAVSAWRKYIREQQKAAAQEARQTTTTAQEA